MSMTAVSSMAGVTSYLFVTTKVGVKRVWANVSSCFKDRRDWPVPEIKIPFVPLGSFSGGFAFKLDNVMRYACELWKNPRELGQNISGPLGTVYFSIDFSLSSVAPAAISMLALTSLARSRAWLESMQTTK